LHDIRSKCNDGNERTVTIQWYTVVSRDNLEEQLPDNRIKVSSDLQSKSEAKGVGQALRFGGFGTFVSGRCTYRATGRGFGSWVKQFGSLNVYMGSMVLYMTRG